MLRFCSDRRGNVAVIFALALLPILGAMGAAVDYSMANSDRTGMQKALDGAALALARLMPAEQATLDRRGMEFLAANMSDTRLTDLRLSVTAESGVLKLEASGTYKPSLINLLGMSTFQIGARSEAKWTSSKAELQRSFDRIRTKNWNGNHAERRRAMQEFVEQFKASARGPHLVK